MMRNSILLPRNAHKVGSKFYNKETYADFDSEYLGEEVQGSFYPSYYCLELFAKENNSVIVNTKNAWQFTLGKALAFDAVISENEIKKSPYFVVKNGNNEILGVVEKKAKSYYNIFDIGHYLRREMDE